MRLTGLRARDFMAYEWFELDLSATPTVVITGDNGAGKSALLDAIRWALFGEVGREISSRDLIIRDCADSAMVEVDFEARGHAITVEREKQRGRTAALTLTVDDAQATHHTIAETEAAIVELIGLDADALMAGPFMEQETAAAFMKARPADRKDLLARLFGLDRYDRLWREAADRHTVVKTEAAAARTVMATAEQAIAGEAAAQEGLEYERGKLAAFTEAQSLASTRRDEARERLAEARTRAERHAALALQRDNLVARISTTEGEQTALVARLRTARVIVDRPVSAFDAETLRVAEDALEQAQAAAGTRSRLLGQLDAVTGRVATAEANHETMLRTRATLATVPCGGEGIYASCRFLTSAPSAAQVIEAEDRVEAAKIDREVIEMAIRELVVPDTRDMRQHVSVLREQMQTARREETIRAGAIATLDEGDRALAALRDQVVAMRAERERVDAEMEEAGHAKAAVTEWRGTLEDAEAAYAQAREAANRHAANVRVHETTLVGIEAAKATHAEWSAKAADLDALAGSLMLLAGAFHRDGIPTTILARGIPFIEAEANRVLDALPGGLSLALRTQRAKATGGMAETLDVVVIVSGWEREYGLLSVGQRFRVDLALRLGLARVLTHRTGGSIETLWLDEPLAALDVAGRQAVMETLAALQADVGLIVVVSHDATFNDSFGARVDVEQVDGVSTARLAA